MGAERTGQRGPRRIPNGTGGVGSVPALVLGMLATGCVPLSERIAEDATPVATEEALETIAEPQNAEELARLLRDPAIAAAVRDVSQEVARGMVAAAREGDIDLRALTDDTVRALSPSLAGGFRRDIAPALEAAVRRSTHAALEEALSAGNLRRVQTFSAAVTEETVQTLTAEVASVLVPEMTSRLFESATEAADEIDVADAEAVVGRLSYAAARQGVLGANDGLRALQQQERPSFLDPVTARIERALRWLPWISLTLGLLALIGLGSLVWLAYATGRGRYSHRRALAQRDEAIRLLLQTMKSAEDRPWSGELRELLRKNLRDEHGTEPGPGGAAS